MTKQEIIEALEEGEEIHYDCWTFTKDSFVCDFGCCYDSFDNIEECEECLINYVKNDWDNVVVINNE